MDRETRTHLARTVAALRERRRLTQSELGRRAGIAQTAVSYIERPDGKSPSLDTLTHLADALRVPLWALFLPQLPDDLRILSRVERIAETYLAIDEPGRATLDTIAEAEARYHAGKHPQS